MVICFFFLLANDLKLTITIKFVCKWHHCYIVACFFSSCFFFLPFCICNFSFSKTDDEGNKEKKLNYLQIIPSPYNANKEENVDGEYKIVKFKLVSNKEMYKCVRNKKKRKNFLLLVLQNVIYSYLYITHHANLAKQNKKKEEIWEKYIRYKNCSW